jgi:MFS family permease
VKQAIATDASVKLGPLEFASGIGRLNAAIYLYQSFVTVALFSFLSFAQPYVLSEVLRIPAEATGRITGALITMQEIVGLLLVGYAGALSDRVGRRRLLVGGWLLYALVYLGFAAITEGWQAWVLLAGYGVYYALTEGVAKAFVADLVPAELRGTAFGVFNAAIGLMAFPASFIAGVLWQGAFGWSGLGPGAPFYLGAALALLAALLLLALPPSKTRS